MPLDPSIYRNIDTNFGLKLADLVNPASIAQRRAAADEQAMGNQLRQMQVMQGVEQMRRAPVLAQREEQQYQAQQAEAQRVQQERSRRQAMIDSLPEDKRRLLDFGVSPEKVLMPKEASPSDVLARERFEWEKRKAGAGGRAKLSFSESQGGFIEPPSAQFPNGRIIKVPGAGTSSAPNRKPMTADQEAKYRQKFGDAYGSTMTALQSSDDVVATAKALRDSPGLEGMSGLSGYIPNMPGGKSAGAQQQFETLQGKITKMAKEAAAASGSIGPMAVQEWKILRDQVVAIDPTKLDAKQMQEVLDYLVIQSEKAARITEETYTSTFGPDFEQYPQFANPRAAVPKQPNQPTQPTAGDAEAVAWARANPNDPRAAQIMSLHGR